MYESKDIQDERRAFFAFLRTRRTLRRKWARKNTVLRIQREADAAMVRLMARGGHGDGVVVPYIQALYSAQADRVFGR